MFASLFAPLARRRVRRGAAQVERHYGPRWIHEVHTGPLDMSDAGLCVLGQLYGSYWRGLDMINGGLTGSRYGFACGVLLASVFKWPASLFWTPYYKALDAAWRREIAARRIRQARLEAIANAAKARVQHTAMALISTTPPEWDEPWD